MRAVDTNVLVRLIVRDDAEQVGSAQEFVSSGVWISVLAVAETVWVLRSTYGFEPAQLADAVDLLLATRNAVVQEPEAVAAATRLFRERPNLGFADCLMLELAREAGHLPLGTFDRNLAKVPGAHKL